MSRSKKKYKNHKEAYMGLRAYCNSLYCYCAEMVNYYNNSDTTCEDRVRYSAAMSAYERILDFMDGLKV